MASAEFHHFERLRGRLAEIGEEPTGAMEPFVAAYDGFHKQAGPLGLAGGAGQGVRRRLHRQ
ncbi:hypothetical protein SFUMM280S_11047 [Streptomyces fumanus]